MEVPGVKKWIKYAHFFLQKNADSVLNTVCVKKHKLTTKRTPTLDGFLRPLGQLLFQRDGFGEKDIAVSYTHLDVYKRQSFVRERSQR